MRKQENVQAAGRREEGGHTLVCELIMQIILVLLLQNVCVSLDRHETLTAEISSEAGLYRSALGGLQISISAERPW